MNLQTALIIPGFGEQNSENYQTIARWCRLAGLTPEFVPISWSRTVLTENIDQFKKIYRGHDPTTSVILGYFSWCYDSVSSCCRA